MERRWVQYVTDHEDYEESKEHCCMWLEDLKTRLSSISITNGDQEAILNRKEQVQELTAEKDQGLNKLQVALDNMQIILPNTSVAGRDAVRREMQCLHQDYDAVSQELTKVRGTLEGCLSQYSVYMDGCGQLQGWMRDLEDQLESEAELQSTLEEKKLQLDRIKVIV